MAKFEEIFQKTLLAGEVMVNHDKTDDLFVEEKIINLLNPSVLHKPKINDYWIFWIWGNEYINFDRNNPLKIEGQHSWEFVNGKYNYAATIGEDGFVNPKSDHMYEYMWQEVLLDFNWRIHIYFVIELKQFKTNTCMQNIDDNS